MLCSFFEVDTFGCKSDGGFVLLQDGTALIVGWTALMDAPLGGHSEVVQMLLLAGVNKDAADTVGCRGAAGALGLRDFVFVTRS